MSATNRSIYHFGEFHLETAARLLARKGERVPLGSKAFEVLACLVAHAGDVVSKDVLLKTVWPNSFVEENNLSQHIFTLRKALGDRADYIVTVPGRGYQFTGRVLEIVPAIPKPSAPESAAAVEVETVPAVVPEETPAAPAAAEHEEPELGAAEMVPVVVPIPEATRGQGVRRGMWWAAAAVALVGLLLLGGWRRLRVANAADRYTMVLADFGNSTGDATFDGTLQRALKIELEQSASVDVMSEHEAALTLQSMGRKGDEALTPALAKEVCERGKRQVVLVGCIAGMGREYLLTLEARDCVSGKELVAAKAEVESKEQVLGALDAIADRVRGGLADAGK